LKVHQTDGESIDFKRPQQNACFGRMMSSSKTLYFSVPEKAYPKFYRRQSVV
jgi:hypothetical protein